MDEGAQRAVILDRISPAGNHSSATSKVLEAAIARAVALAPSLSTQIAESLRRVAFIEALAFVDSEVSLTMAKAIWSAVPKRARPGLLAEALSGGDAPYRELSFTVKALRSLKKVGFPVVASEDDQRFLEGLPTRVMVYRGTTQAEVNDSPFFGVCWTTDRDRAIWFATQHGRFRRIDSPSLLLEQIVCKSEVLGAVVDRQEREVFVDPATTYRSFKAGTLAVQEIPAFQGATAPIT